MDYVNPYTQSSGFIALLSSQQQPPQTPEPTFDLGESEAYVFSTQCSETTCHSPTEADDRISRRKWTPTEDVVLISAWLNKSKDLIVGNEQKAEAFWKRIAAYFAASSRLAGLQKREDSHCKQRWSKINDSVCKFVGCYKTASSQKASGKNDNDVMKVAPQIYFNDHKQKFTLEQAWLELRHDQKWCHREGTGTPKRRQTEEGSTQSSSSVSFRCEENLTRPCGVKAAKAKTKKTVTKKTEENMLLDFQRMWEIKEKDLAMKERLSKHKLLDSLLAKTEALSDMEMALKDKLITEMMNS